MKVSIFKTGKSVAPEPVELEEVIEGIRTGRWERQIETCRRLLAESKDKYKTYRTAHVPHFGSHVVFKNRSKGTDSERFQSYTGLCQLDFDDVGNKSEEILAKARDSEHVAACFISPSGKGVKVLIRVAQAEHRPHYLAIAKQAGVFATSYFGLAPEAGTLIDPSRLCAVSFDPGAWSNPNATPLPFDRVPEGCRHDTIKTIVASGVARGLTDDAIFAEVRSQIPDHDKTDAEIARLIDYFRAKEKPKNGADAKERQSENDRLDALLDASRYDPSIEVERPVPVLLLDNHVVATPGNLVSISAQAKAGKSSFLSACIGALFRECDPASPLLLGVSAPQSEGAVLHFDTEQSRFDWHMLLKVAARRAGRQLPQSFCSHHLVEYDIRTRRAMLERAIERIAEHEPLRAVFLDGVADFVSDPNNSEECFDLVARLHALAIKFSTVVVCVLHHNPATDFNKMRGHLGSQIERKAETNLVLTKDGDDTVVWTERSRHCQISKVSGVRFVWSDTERCHVRISSLNEARARAAADEMVAFAAAVFSTAPSGGLSWGDLMVKIKSLAGLKDAGARRRIERMAAAGVIVKNLLHKYEFQP